MDKKTKELYENSMINDIIENYLEEGINDTAIFKAVFLAGGPGSGKSFIGTEKKGKSPTVGADPKQFMGGGQLGLINLGLRVVNPDPAYEKLLKAAGLDPKSSDDIWSDEGQDIRVKASAMTAKQKAHYVNERLGIIIDGTGKDVNKIIGQKKLLDDAGYETAMIYVNTNLETAIARDAKRDRTLGANAVTKMWDAVQKNVKKYKSIFGSSMYIIDNSDGSNWLGESQKAHKKIEKWVRKSPSSPKAKAWIASQSKMRNAPKGGIREDINENVLGRYATAGRKMAKRDNAAKDAVQAAGGKDPRINEPKTPEEWMARREYHLKYAARKGMTQPMKDLISKKTMGIHKKSASECREIHNIITGTKMDAMGNWKPNEKFAVREYPHSTPDHITREYNKKKQQYRKRLQSLQTSEHEDTKDLKRKTEKPWYAAMKKHFASHGYISDVPKPDPLDFGITWDIRGGKMPHRPYMESTTRKKLSKVVDKAGNRTQSDRVKDAAKAKSAREKSDMDLTAFRKKHNL